MSKTAFDIVFIGAGPAGYVGAIRAAQLGFSTAVVEAHHLGGICLNWGCIPTKALLRVAEVGHLAKRGAEFGWDIKVKGFDLARMVAYSRSVARQLSQGVRGLLRKNKVTIIEGMARLDGPNNVFVEGKKGKENLEARHIVLATGARARELPFLPFSQERIWSYKEALMPPFVPKKLMVVGSGAIGVEFASFFNDLGTEVTLVEVLDRILPAEDVEISALAQKSFGKAGLRIFTSAKIEEVKAAKTRVTTGFLDGDGKEQAGDFDALISAVGIVGNVENLGLEGSNVRVENSHVVVDAFGATDEPGVYAVGDLAGPPWLAHKASHEAVILVEKLAGRNVLPLNKTRIPGCTYARPQIASVGLTEEAARAGGRKIKVGRFPFIGNGKAIALGEPEGLVKTLFDEKSGELLGAHMLGAEVTELIQGYAIAMGLETSEAELMHTVFPHPTLSEMMHESVLAAYGRAIHF